MRSPFIKTVSIAASFWMLGSISTASAVGLKGFGWAIAARIRKGASRTTAPGDTAESLWLGAEDRIKAASAQCRADLREADGIGELALGAMKQKWPRSCLVDGAKCPIYDFHGMDAEPEVPAGTPMCLAPYKATVFDLLCFDFWFWIGSLALCGVIVSVGTLYTAKHSLKHGDEAARTAETMTYEERLLAVSTLSLACGGATILFLVYEAFLLRCIWILLWTWWVFIPLVLFMVSTAVAMRRLEYKIPNKAILRHRLFKVWRDYFGFELVYDDYDLFMDVLAVKGRQFLLAQMPHAVMPYGAILAMSVAEDVFPGVWPMSGVVASALMATPVVRHAVNILGVREAGTRSIMKMFADGFQAIAVITGGIAEMFVSRNTETLTCLRKGFAKIALRGGYPIIPVFVFGVSRTHYLVPGADNRLTRFLSRKMKVPLVAFYGAFGLAPHRQKMKMVVGSPIIVEKASSDVTDDQAQALCDEVQAAVLKLYEDHKPAWETRPVVFER